MSKLNDIFCKIKFLENKKPDANASGNDIELCVTLRKIKNVQTRYYAFIFITIDCNINKLTKAQILFSNLPH